MFTIADGKVKLKPQYLLIPEFEQVMKDYKDYSEGLRMLAYVYYVADYDSPYLRQYSLDNIDKGVAKEFLKDENFEPTENIKKAIEAYMKLQDVSTMKYLKASRSMADKLTKHFEELELDTLFEANKLVQVIKALAELPKIVKSIADMEKAVTQQIAERGAIKGGGKLGNREDPRNKRRR